MPEYLSPGVYIEETSFRAKSIQGVATSTAGFVGPCRFGPTKGRPPLVTSFEEFRRTFGGIEDLVLNNIPKTNQMAHAVKAFFDNGGQRLYIARVFAKNGADTGVATSAVYKRDAADFKDGATNLAPRFVARSPGLYGNVHVLVKGVRSGNLVATVNSQIVLQGVKPGDIVEISKTAGAKPKPREVSATVNDETKAHLEAANLRFVIFDDQGRAKLTKADGTDEPLSGVTLAQRVTLTVEVGKRGERLDAYNNLSTHPSSALYIGKVLRDDEPEDTAARVFFRLHDDDPLKKLAPAEAGDLLISLVETGEGAGVDLSGGADGIEPGETEYVGGGVDVDVTGLVALAEIDDIAIVAAPGGCSEFGNDTSQQGVRNALITHCENLKYRFAILSGKKTLDEGQIRNLRSQHDTTYAALYYPWITIADPFGRAGELLDLPPEGFIAGVYARTDIERGVHKAPANEIVRGALRFSRSVNKGQQDTLNPEGINCLRSFESRGHRVWGARTLTSDPEWTYVNVRRLFIFLEHSIDKSTQWVVFEPNNETLWLKVRLTIESFLLDVWRTGALLGAKPEDAYFVRCDRSTMTQSDLDNGRLVVLVGVAPTKPAEFVIFRIGQWTADASII